MDTMVNGFCYETSKRTVFLLPTKHQVNWKHHFAHIGASIIVIGIDFNCIGLGRGN